ncbi:MAG: hypothetical protein NTZ50_03795 [Chloroflexi bacterium]|nr:hypothetical protein [Chloroflexota bacterium]
MKKILTRALLLAVLFAAASLAPARAQTPPPAPVVSAQSLVDAFTAAGLAVAPATPMLRADYGKAPFVCKGMQFVVPATEPAAYGRAFYCARKADGERLESYYMNIWRKNPAEAVHVLAQRPFVLVLDKALSGEVVGKFRAALPAVVGGNAIASAASPISVKVERMSYVRWGRPYFMYDPSQPCTSVDNSHAVFMLQVVAAITNNSPNRAMPLGSWHMQFYRLNGAPAATCNYTSRGRVTKETLKNDWDRASATRTAEDTLDGREQIGIPPGGTATLTYAVFVETNDRVAYGEVTDAVLGTSNRIEVPPTVPMP